MAEPLVNMYSDSFIQAFAAAVKTEYSAFNEQKFIDTVLNENWPSLALKQRINHIAASLKETLPSNYVEAIRILMRLQPTCSGFPYLFLPQFVAMFGLKDWDISMEALALFTEGSSSEFAVRPFIVQNTEIMMQQMLSWANSDNHHIRRLASEGCRPKLPWATPLPQFIHDPAPIFPILERLKEDESEYVRKSVANNLNDISKNHPQLVIELAKKWYGSNEKTDWIVKHACRTLLRKANPQVLSLFSFSKEPSVAVSEITIEQEKLAIGEQLNFSFAIHSTLEKPQKIRVEYAIDYVKANGRTSRKLFKISEITLDQPSKTYSRKLSFKNLSTRTHYPGMHHISIVINGVEQISSAFELTN